MLTHGQTMLQCACFSALYLLDGYAYWTKTAFSNCLCLERASKTFQAKEMTTQSILEAAIGQGGGYLAEGGGLLASKGQERQLSGTPTWMSLTTVLWEKSPIQPEAVLVPYSWLCLHRL